MTPTSPLNPRQTKEQIDSKVDATPDSAIADGIPAQQERTVAYPGEAAAQVTLPAIPGYEILSVIGRGGMGVVYEAKHRALKRTVALKMILAGGHAGPRELARFRIEAEAVARLQHPNIVQVFEVGEADGHPYCALEFIGGGNLAKAIGGKPLSAKVSAVLVEALARAMQLAHSRNVVHRDLKPANILLTPLSTAAEEPGVRGRSDLGTPKITDFGLARHTDSDSDQTQAGAIMGTPSYMAPEQASGRTHEAGPAADIYALGAILYECLTGRPPFQGKTTLETLDQVRTQEPLPPSRGNKSVPLDLETICLKCLRKEPEKRYFSAAELADDLRRFLDGHPVHARPVGTAEKFWSWCRRKPALAGAGALAILAFIMVSKLAVDNKRLAHDADRRREQSDELAVRIAFNHLYSQSRENPALAIVGTAQLLPKARRLREQALYESLLSHLGGWGPEVQTTRLRWIGGHGDAVACVALSADGKTALTGSTDKTARLWDTATGQPISPPLQHLDWVHAVALSADGKTALTGSWDKTARLWETATGKPIGPPLQHQGKIFAVALSADGKTALTGTGDKSARLWDTATGTPIGPPLQHQGGFVAVALSADGKTALTGSMDGTARLWITSTGEPIGPPLQHQGVVPAVALSADGKTALTGSWDKTARLWEAATGKPIGPPLQHQDWVHAVALSADGKTALTGSADKTARLWETATGKPIGPPLQHQDKVLAVALSADGKTALTGGYDKTVRLWDTAGKPIGPSLHHQGLSLAVALSADGKTALTGGNDETARLWETATGQPIGPPLQHQGTVHCVVLSADAKTALTASSDKTARLWDTASGKPIGPPLQHQDVVRAAALSADGKTVLTGSADKTARLWEMASGKPIGPLLQHQAPVYAVALSADGKIALTGSQDTTARLWEASTGKPIGPPLQHQDAVNGVALSADGKTALTGGFDKMARLWNTATGNPIGPSLQHRDPIYAVALSADGKTALTGSMDGTVRLWETATGQQIGPSLHHDLVNAVALSADGKTALTGGNNTARLWRLIRFVDDPEHIALWAQVLTGIEADPFSNARVLSADEWIQRKIRLEKLGGAAVLD